MGLRSWLGEMPTGKLPGCGFHQDVSARATYNRRVVSAVVSALHLLALGLGLPSIYLRGRALKGKLDAEGLRRLFTADNVWAGAAALWLVTGLLRAFAGLEKGTAFYLNSALFWTKMGLFAAVLALEVGPMITLIRWRRQLARGTSPDTQSARTLYLLSHVEMALVIVIVFVASFMARGFGLR
jgi:putative membrane protein